MREEYQIPKTAKLQVSPMEIYADFSPLCTAYKNTKFSDIRIRYYFFNGFLKIKSLTE